MTIKNLVVPIVALGALFLTAIAADAQVQVTVNGSAVNLSPPPITRAGRVFVPLRGVFEQLGASVVYANGTINATGNGRDISLQIGSTQATVNDQPQTIDVAPFIVGESTYVPLRFISEALGNSVSWDEADEIAAIDTGGGPADYFTPGTASYVDTPPPPIPQYEQPYVPAPNVIWQPGYWGWGSYGYYWVPGTWVQAPQPGYLWTPGYWQWNNGGYNWNPGYWAIAIGFYGGVNYGGGYFGRGYDGGEWSNDEFRYNTYVTRVNTTIVRNVYVNRTVYVNPSPTRIGYNGGRGGLRLRPTAQQAAVARDRHFGMTRAQQLHVHAAEQDRRLLATVNGNKPPLLAIARPLNAARPPAGFVPMKAGDRVDPQANVAPVHVAPVHVAPARVARPVAHVPTVAPRVAPPLKTPPVTHLPERRPAPVGTPVAPRRIVPLAAPVHSAARVLPVHAAPPGRVPAVYAAPQLRRPITAPAHAPPVRAAAPAHVPPAHPGPPAHRPPRA